MARTSNLRKAKADKNDEFYTRYEDIEKEITMYKEQLGGKTILCNCDDPETSNFWKFFHNNFAEFKLKKLISTHYTPHQQSYAMIYDGNNDTKIPIENTYNSGFDIFDICEFKDADGDFRSKQCIEYLKEADVVITNPPFSLFREYIAQLIQYDKKFIILGNMNSVACKEIFPLIKDGKMWAGYGFNIYIIFKAPYSNEIITNRKYVEAQGLKLEDGYMTVPSIAWFTNLDTTKRHTKIELTKEYNEKDYPKYDNYDAIEVSKVANIPKDYYGIMGVPISFLDKHNNEQFEIVGAAMGWCKNALTDEEKKALGYSEEKVKSGYGHIDGEQIYHRILIKRVIKGGITDDTN